MPCTTCSSSSSSTDFIAWRLFIVLVKICLRLKSLHYLFDEFPDGLPDVQHGGLDSAASQYPGQPILQDILDQTAPKPEAMLLCVHPWRPCVFQISLHLIPQGLLAPLPTIPRRNH